MARPKQPAFPARRARATTAVVLSFGLFCAWGPAARSASARIFVSLPALTQQAETPSLQQRPPDDAPVQSVRNDKTPPPDRQPSNLPKDVSGAYAFDHSGESIEIDIDRGKLSGYITRLGDAETDSNTPLTYFFDRTALNGDQLQFETRVVHGIWYSFNGTVVRGPGQARSDEGYYVLQGTLLVHHPSDERDKSSDETVEQRLVHFKSLAQ